MKNHQRQLLLPIALLVIWTPIAHGQRSPNKTKAITYEFVSPNTSENLKLDDAIRKLDSPEEQSLIRETRAVGCPFGVRARIRKSIGIWSDGAENSTVFRISVDEAAARYVAARLGNFARQKSVLYFRIARTGKARMYLLAVTRTRSLTKISETLGNAGIAYRTLVLRKRSVLVYIVDLTNELHAQVRSASARLGTHANTFAGDGEFIGDDNDRDKAQLVFADEIKRYEATHALRPCRAQQ